MDKRNPKRKTNVKNNKQISQTKKDIIDCKNTISLKKTSIFIVAIVVIFLLLVIRLFYLQFIDNEHLSELALKQQSSSELITSKRGNIYDSSGIPLAISETVDTITINPKKIKGKTDEKTAELKKLVAKGLSEIFELDYDEVYKKVTSTASSETIIKKVELDKVKQLEQWMKDNKITIGINIDEDSKRYYPYGTLASNLIGTCGTDNKGLSGIEYSYNTLLTGTSGKLVTSIDASQSEIPNTEETFVAAEDGSNIDLTIDINIQKIVEKYLKQGVEDNKCEGGGNAIVMQPSTGKILANASYPNYDLNSPFTPTSFYADNWDNLTSEEKSERIQKMWKIRSVSETYEPGSVFKLITASVALEENITGTDVANDFYCSGSEHVVDRNMKCWRSYNPHESETLREALMDSCNPSFIQLGRRIGSPTLYKYYDAFGFFDKTNVGLSGEASGIFHKLDDVSVVDLATMSFGQRFTITPLQMCSAVCAIVNDGYLMQPQIINSITTSSSETTYIQSKTIRQVISKDTSDKMKSMMQSVVTNGTGKTARVNGYSVGGKSGTSEPSESNPDSGYVASFVGISPVENTDVVVLVTLYKPQGVSHQGGQTAGPVVANILSEILPSLGIEPDQN